MAAAAVQRSLLHQKRSLVCPSEQVCEGWMLFCLVWFCIVQVREIDVNVAGRDCRVVVVQACLHCTDVA